jgi:hypothetical protein
MPRFTASVHPYPGAGLLPGAGWRATATRVVKEAKTPEEKARAEREELEEFETSAW